MVMKKSLLLSVSIFLISAAAQMAHAEFLKDCKKDIEQFCAKVEVGEGRVLKCLKENEAKLSAKCKQQETNMMNRPKKKQ